MAYRKVELKFNDIELGCEEFGFIARREGEEVDDEDARYERHVREKLGDEKARVRVIDAMLYIET